VADSAVAPVDLAVEAEASMAAEAEAVSTAEAAEAPMVGAEGVGNRPKRLKSKFIENKRALSGSRQRSFPQVKAEKYPYSNH
jgi:hypothetical protein